MRQPDAQARTCQSTRSVGDRNTITRTWSGTHLAAAQRLAWRSSTIRTVALVLCIVAC